MHAFPDLIRDLAIILLVAALALIIFRRLGWPSVLGHLLAGLLVGPHISSIPTVTEVHSIQLWAQLGILILIFTVGLQFSFRRLSQVGSKAVAVALFEVFLVGLSGFALAKLMGLGALNALYLGGMICVSSTMVVARLLEGPGLKRQRFGEWAMSILVVEDLMAVILLVIFSALGAGQKLRPQELIEPLVKMVLFICTWFAVGILILPTLMRRLSMLLTDEVMVIFSLGLCLSIALLAAGLGLSPALGAFMVGSTLAETMEARRMSRLLAPIKDLFSAIFFVSVGMLIDPSIFLEHWKLLLLLTSVLLLGKTIGVGLACLLAGLDIRNSMKTALALAQIGEFSFILAMVAQKNSSSEIPFYALAVAVCVLSTAIGAFLFKRADGPIEMLESILPRSLSLFLLRYREAIETPQEATVIVFHLKWEILKIFLKVSVIWVLIILGKKILLPLALAHSLPWPHLLTLLAITLLCSPLLWALLFKVPILAQQESEGKQTRNLSRAIIRAIRLILGIVLCAFMIASFANGPWAMLIITMIGAVAFKGFSKWFDRLYGKIEGTLIFNLQQESGVDESDELP